MVTIVTVFLWGAHYGKLDIWVLHEVSVVTVCILCVMCSKVEETVEYEAHNTMWQNQMVALC